MSALISTAMIWTGVAVLAFGLAMLIRSKERKMALLTNGVGGLALLAGNVVQWIF